METQQVEKKLATERQVATYKGLCNKLKLDVDPRFCEMPRDEASDMIADLLQWQESLKHKAAPCTPVVQQVESTPVEVNGIRFGLCFKLAVQAWKGDVSDLALVHHERAFIQNTITLYEVYTRALEEMHRQSAGAPHPLLKKGGAV